MDRQQVEVNAAFVQQGDTVIHPEDGVPLVVHHIDRYPEKRSLQIHYASDDARPSKLRHGAKINLVVQSRY